MIENNISQGNSELLFSSRKKRHPYNVLQTRYETTCALHIDFFIIIIFTRNVTVVHRYDGLLHILFTHHWVLALVNTCTTKKRHSCEHPQPQNVPLSWTKQQMEWARFGIFVQTRYDKRTRKPWPGSNSSRW